ncbi:MAG: CoA transferase, partial [Luteimonas sp.]|nr:CoA transferase [Luteimonas sp.]
LAAMDAVKVPANPVNRIDQVFDDAQVRARGLRIELPHASGQPVPMVRNPLKFSATPLQYQRAAPVLGQDTRAVLADVLGIDEGGVDALQAEGVVQASRSTDPGETE